MAYPVFLNIKDRLCVVVGGGSVGLRKAQGLVAAGARVRLVAPVAPEAEELPAGLEFVRSEYRSGDLDGAFLAFAATDDRAVNAAVADEAKRLGVPVNVADVPEEGDFSLPAQFSRGDLCVAVSTRGNSPAFAVLVKEYLTTALGAEWAVFLDIASALRQKGQAADKELLVKLLKKKLPDLISSGDESKTDVVLKEVLGHGCSLAELGITLDAKDG
ncbi:MAG: bifunctional precorrin-2 dehydrogenase/sirohydrochlorin ferrochelatase [Deltaproteobacteria bacterium]|nr:bifunctional precorrin-2 dehydrogenase/sirohydrochlorin ferrochelatase [Deltaproteobacteria bacterium]